MLGQFDGGVEQAGAGWLGGMGGDGAAIGKGERGADHDLFVVDVGEFGGDGQARVAATEGAEPLPEADDSWIQIGFGLLVIGAHDRGPPGTLTRFLWRL